MIEIGCQTYSLRAYPTAEMLLCARKAGFRSVELWVGHADHAGGAPAAAEVRRVADDLGIAIRVYSVGGFARVGLATVEKELRSAFAFGAALGVDLMTGVVDRRAVSLVDELCRESGIRFAIENHWYADFACAEDYADALAGASPLVGVALDTGHALAAGQRPTAALAVLGERVFDVHLKDAVVRGRLARWVLRRARFETRTVGTGDGELADFLAALAERDYQGEVAIEDERPEVPLAELHASLRAATAALRAATRPLAEAAS